MANTTSDDGWQVVESKATKRSKVFKKKPIPEAPPLPDRVDTPAIYPTRHGFRPPLIFRHIGRRDKYCAAANKILFHHNTRSFAHFMDPLEISSLDFRKHVSRQHNTSARMYALGRCGFIARVPMFFARNGRGEECLMVMTGNTAVHLEAWIGGLPHPTHPEVTGERGYQLLRQYHQCVANHKKSKHTFASMPDDIQDIILLHMVGEVRPVKFLPSNDRNDEVFDLHDDSGANHRRMSEVAGDAAMLPALDPGLLCLNKTINQRVRTIAQCWSIKRIRSKYELGYLINHGSASVLSRLNKVQLAFTDFEYFEFFGVDVPGHTRLSETPDAAILKRLPCVSYLEIWYEAPINDGDHSDEWTRFGGGSFACRKGMVDAIMSAAVPYIMHIPKINIAGCVKTASRTFWLDLFQTKPRSATDPRVLEKQRLALIPKDAEESSMKCKCPIECVTTIELPHPENYTDYRNPWDGAKAARSDRRHYQATIAAYRFDFDDVYDRENEKVRIWEIEYGEKPGTRSRSE